MGEHGKLFMLLVTLCLQTQIFSDVHGRGNSSSYPEMVDPVVSYKNTMTALKNNSKSSRNQTPKTFQEMLDGVSDPANHETDLRKEKHRPEEKEGKLITDSVLFSESKPASRIGKRTGSPISAAGYDFMDSPAYRNQTSWLSDAPHGAAERNGLSSASGGERVKRTAFSFFAEVGYDCSNKEKEVQLDAERKLEVTCPREGASGSSIDLVFIQDSSTSVTDSDYRSMKEYIIHFLQIADIDGGTVRVGIIIFSTSVYIICHLDTYNTKAEVFEAVREIPRKHGSTNTAEALKIMRTELFTASRGDRPDVPNVAILITDGVSNIHPALTIPEAIKAREKGIHIYAIGIGLTDTQELDGIASKPVKDNRFVVQDFSAVHTLREKVLNDSHPGYIQTAGWDGRTQYKPFMDACVTVTSPGEDHTVMISFVALDLQTCVLCGCDVLELYLTSACQGRPESVICDRSQAVPAAFRTRFLSVRFRSNAEGEGTGFRLLYSFHPPDNQPHRLRNGRWDCSSDRGPLLVKHFICSTEVLCGHAEDSVAGCPPLALCGDISVHIGHRCYRYIKPTRKITWSEATATCWSTSGDLVTLGTEQEWSNVADFWVGIPSAPPHLWVGLRQSSYWGTPDMYSFMWQWSNRNTAFYLNISHLSDSVSPPYCAAFQQKEGHLTVTSCNSPLQAHILCEYKSQSRWRKSVRLPAPNLTISDNPHLTECPNKQLTYTLWPCDESSGCDADIEQCSHQRQDTLVSRTMFTCESGAQLVSYSVVCDHRPDCEDGSDEAFCSFPPCPSGHFLCDKSKQCILEDFYCDGIHHCVDRTDEQFCWDLTGMSESNTVLPPAIIDFTGTGRFTVTALDTSQGDPVCPETHFQCPQGGYCLPVYVRCNGVSDCLEGEDEADCETYTCPGFYRCRGAKNCVHVDNLCDEILHCPRHDDELLCNLTCPNSCMCVGFSFLCSEKFPADLFPQLRYLNADGTGMNLQDVANNMLLIHLSLRYCGIKELGVVNLPNVRILDLSHNSLSSITREEMHTFRNVRSLSLAFNEMLAVDALNVEIFFSHLIFLDVSGGNTPEITNTSFTPFPNIQHLNLSGSRLDRVVEPGFEALEKLRVLDLSDCPLTELYGDMFKGLSNLEAIHASKFHVCCPSILPEDFDPENCHAPSDEVSSCAALLRADVFRVFLALYAFFAVVGNSVSFVYRVFGKGVTTQLGFDIFVTHLCVSDFLMGVYLAIVGIADRVYYGSYEWNAAQWKQSVACQMAGFLSLLSSEMSAFLICFITLERFMLIRFPHKNLRFTPKMARVACTAGWMVGVLLAAIPLLPFSPPWDFYSQTGICIPLPITRKVFPGSEYSFYVMIVFNFILFILIAIGQLLIFWSVRSQTKTVSSSSKKVKDMAIARRLLAVVMTDFFCWFPIGLLGLMARNGTPISGDINVAIAIFVLPFNSALNPFLYTFHVLIERRRVARARRQAGDRGEGSSVTCPTCARREQGTSRGPPSLGSSGKSVPNATASDAESSNEETLGLIERFLEEHLMSPERLLHLTEIVRDRRSPVQTSSQQTSNKEPEEQSAVITTV